MECRAECASRLHMGAVSAVMFEFPFEETEDASGKGPVRGRPPKKKPRSSAPASSAAWVDAVLGLPMFDSDVWEALDFMPSRRDSILRTGGRFRGKAT